VAEMVDAGFDVVESVDRWPGNSYCVVFGRPNAGNSMETH